MKSNLSQLNPEWSSSTFIDFWNASKLKLGKVTNLPLFLVALLPFSLIVSRINDFEGLMAEPVISDEIGLSARIYDCKAFSEAKNLSACKTI
jgi:hypothetical protein